MKNYRTLSPDQLFKWAENNTEIMRLRTDRDLLPGGYMAALAPMLAAWNDSQYQETEGFLILRNVNYGGNSFERTTVLQSVRVPLDGLEGAETGTDARIPDLVLSWESWRPPDRGFSLKEGLDESTYGLSLRAFAGPQRYLEDSIRRRDWFSYRLRLPGGTAGVRELFIVCAALGDGVARDTIHRLLRQGGDAWLAHAPHGDADGEQTAGSANGHGESVTPKNDSRGRHDRFPHPDPLPEGEGDGERAARDFHGLAGKEIWERLNERLRSAAPAVNLAPALSTSEQSYQVLVRSCAALARYAILVAVHRLLGRGMASEVVREKLPAPELEQPEPWMKEVARADLRGLFLHAPAAIRFLTHSPSVIPAKIPDELDAAGLLQRRDGKPWRIRYGRDATRPYGPNGLNPVE